MADKAVKVRKADIRSGRPVSWYNGQSTRAPGAPQHGSVARIWRGVRFRTVDDDTAAMKQVRARGAPLPDACPADAGGVAPA